MQTAPPEFLTQSAAAKFIGKNRCTLRDWDRTGKLPGDDMDRESITIQMDGDKAGRLRQLAANVDMHLEAYCAMVLANHIMRKADIDAAQGGDK